MSAPVLPDPATERMAPEEPESLRVWRRCFEEAGVTRSVLLASTFRSGSTRVAATLGVNGVPGLGKERFQGAWRTIGKPPDPVLATFLQGVLAEVSGGVFASKLMWPQFVQVARALGFGRSDAPRLAALFGEARWLQVRRLDKIAQAVSFWRAKQTGRWHVYRDEAEPAPEYDFKAIRACLHELEMDDRLWDDFFALASIVPVRVIYEEFEADVEGGMRRILEGLGRPVPAALQTRVALRRQRDALSGEYRERFLEDIYRGVTG